MTLIPTRNYALRPIVLFGGSSQLKHCCNFEHLGALTTIIFRDAIVSTSWGGEISEGGDSTTCFLYQIQNMFGPPLVLLGHCYESLGEFNMGFSV